MADPTLIPAGSGAAVWLRRGDLLRVIDPHGGQSGDVFALSADGSERLSNGCTFDYQGKIYLTTGDVLWSDRSNPMLTIMADDAGRHDFLYASCTAEMYRLQYGATDYHPNCADSLGSALRELGLDPGPPPTAFNVFMRADVGADGKLEFGAPATKAGDAITFRAEMDLAVAISSCPASACNAGGGRQPLAFEILPAGEVAA